MKNELLRYQREELDRDKHDGNAETPKIGDIFLVLRTETVGKKIRIDTRG